MKDREDRKKNLVIRKLKVKEGKRIEPIEEILKFIGVEVRIDEIRNVGIGRQGRK